MVAQAQIAGVTMDLSRVHAIDMDNPVIHDPSNAIRFGDPRTAPQAFEIDGLVWGTNTRQLEDRIVAGGVGGGTQRTQTFGPAQTEDSSRSSCASTPRRCWWAGR